MPKPLFAPHAGLTSAQADSAHAALYCEHDSGVLGGLEDDPASLLFYFKRPNGSVDWYSGDELSQQTWWHWMHERVAHTIEAHLFPSHGAETLAEARAKRLGSLLS